MAKSIFDKSEESTPVTKAVSDGWYPGKKISEMVKKFVISRVTQSKTYKALAHSSTGVLLLCVLWTGLAIVHPSIDGGVTKEWAKGVVAKAMDIKVDVEKKLDEAHEKLDLPDEVPVPKIDDVVKPAPAPTNLIVTQEPEVNHNLLTYSFPGDVMRASMSIPKEADEYTFVKLQSDKVGIYDINVMTVKGDEIRFIETVQTINGSEWVFTGPPGKYAVRISIFDPEKGYQVTTGSVEIKRLSPAPAPTPTPVPNPTPNPVPPTPPTPTPPVVVPEGKYVGKNLANAIATIPSSEYHYAPQLADSFEGVAAGIAAGSYNDVQSALTEVAGRNRLVFNNDTKKIETWMPFFNEWSANASKLNKEKKLPNLPSEYRVLFLETASILRAVK